MIGAMALRSSGRTAKLALALAMAGVGAAALKGRLARFEVVEPSMAPALSAGDYLVATLSSSVERGDIVVYPDPARPGRDLIKRVIGLPGEAVTISNGQVAINGAVLAEPWADGPTLPDGDWTNPPGTIFTLGDNRAMSSGDSRASGSIRLVGMYKGVWRYWPLDSVGRI